MASGNAPDDPLVVPELLEAILLKLPQRDILLAQRVSKTWLATITSSLALQQALSFQPALPKEGYILAQGAIKSLGFTTRHRDESRPMTSLEIQCNNEAPFRWWIVKCVPVVLSDVPPANLHRFQSHSAIKTRTALKASLNTLVAEGLSERMTSYATNLDGRANEYGEELLLFDADEKGRAMNWGSSCMRMFLTQPPHMSVDALLRGLGDAHPLKVQRAEGVRLGDIYAAVDGHYCTEPFRLVAMHGMVCPSERDEAELARRFAEMARAGIQA